jgi:hypothetical protein
MISCTGQASSLTLRHCQHGRNNYLSPYQLLSDVSYTLLKITAVLEGDAQLFSTIPLSCLPFIQIREYILYVYQF